MTGLPSAKGTTTMIIVERDDVDLFALIKDHMTKNWYMEETKAFRFAEKDADELHGIAAQFPVGAIVEKRGNAFRQRIPRKVKGKS